jgi:hypothetical protein
MLAVLSACGKGGHSLPRTPADDRFANMYADVVETDGAVFFHKTLKSGALLYYYDKLTGESDVFCSKPECQHSDSSCQAFMGMTNCPSLSYYDGRLWYVSNYAPGSAKLYSIDVNSGERKLEQTFQMPEMYSPQRAAVSCGKLYIGCCGNAVVDGAPKFLYQIVEADIQSGESSTIFEKITDAQQGWPAVFMRFDADSVYFCLSCLGKLGCEIYKWNGSMQEPELIFTDEDTLWINDFYVMEEGKCFISARRGSTGDSEIFMIEDGKAVTSFVLASDDATYGTLYLSKGIAFANGMNKERGSIISVWTLEGSYLVKEEPFGKSIESLSGNYMIGGAGGDAEKLFYLFTEDTEDEANASEISLLLMLRIDGSGVEESIVCSDSR